MTLLNAVIGKLYTTNTISFVMLEVCALYPGLHWKGTILHYVYMLYV